MHLRIEKPVYGGDFLSHTNNGEDNKKTIFVPFSLTGELVEAEVETDKRGVAAAHLQSVIEASPHRIQPRCAHFGACGGCQYQHTTYENQLTIKRSILHETLTRAGLHNLPEIATHAAEPWHYRNRIRLLLQKRETGWQIGYRRRNSHTFLPVHECPITAPRIWQLAQAVVALPSEALPQTASEIEIFTDAEENTLQLSLHLSSPASQIDRSAAATNLRQICDALQQQIPQLRGAGLYVQAETNRSAKTSSSVEIARWGEASTRYTVDDYNYQVSRGAFFQVNRYLTDTMLRLVTEDQQGRLAYDLFAGVGLFSQALTKHFKSVVAVEIGEPAVTDLRAMLQSLGPQHHAIAKTTLDFLKTQKQQPQREFVNPDLIVMDPPRAGIGTEACNLIAATNAPNLVYVSCDPTTLSRDLATLVKSGYTLQQVHLLDLFPQTFHLETVAILQQ